MDRKGFVVVEALSVFFVVAIVIIAYVVYVRSQPTETTSTSQTEVVEELSPTPLPTIVDINPSSNDDSMNEIVDEFNELKSELDDFDNGSDSLKLPEVDFNIE